MSRQYRAVPTKVKDRSILSRQERQDQDAHRNTDGLIRRALQERNASAIVQEEDYGRYEMHDRP